MPFYCPDCKVQKSLYVVASMELAGDSRWDEITLQMLKCEHCQLNVLGVYQESRRGGLDKEIFHHVAYKIDAERVQQVKELMDVCTRPTDAKCPCAAHTELSAQDDQGQWMALEKFGLREAFTFQL
ncbi:MAG: hypothetical protein JEZ00_10660 [Anaerolineaceae bacterium]|nr:hypothetical protein [Anaerolineaceae bacterium]